VGGIWRRRQGKARRTGRAGSKIWGNQLGGEAVGDKGCHVTSLPRYAVVAHATYDFSILISGQFLLSRHAQRTSSDDRQQTSTIMLGARTRALAVTVPGA
jgi:hypothetical protein